MGSVFSLLTTLSRLYCAIINTKDVIDALEAGHIGYLGIDVYENEKGIFFEDLHNKKPVDKMQNIATTTCSNFHHWEMNEASPNELTDIDGI